MFLYLDPKVIYFIITFLNSPCSHPIVCFFVENNESHPILIYHAIIIY